MKKIFLMFFLLQNMLFLYAQYDDPYQYYPIATGNEWYYYMGTSYYYHVKIYADSTDSVGNRFYWSTPKDVIDIPFYSIDTNYFFIIRPTSQINTKEYLYKLDAEIGDWWWVWRGDSADTNTGTWCQLGGVLDGDYHGVPTRIKSYDFYIRVKDNNQYYDYWDHDERLAYGMGLIYRDNDANYPSYLVGAIIDGNVIGNPVNVEETLEKLPGTFELFQNYPNPFNPTTKISFSIPNSGHVSLKVYDILGRELAVLANQILEAGLHQFDFDGKGLSSGIYIYSFRTGDITITKKMQLLK